MIPSVNGRAAALVACALLAACAVPQPALDQANGAANLMMAMQAQMDQLAKRQQAIAAAREDSIRRQRSLALQYDSDASFDARIMAAADETAQLELITTLRDLSDARAAAAQSLDESLKALDDELAKILAPVPSTAKAVSAVQASFGALGQQRGAKERASVLQAFAKEVKKSMDAGGAAKPADSAASAADAAPKPVQAPPPAKKSS